MRRASAALMAMIVALSLTSGFAAAAISAVDNTAGASTTLESNITVTANDSMAEIDTVQLELEGQNWSDTSAANVSFYNGSDTSLNITNVTATGTNSTVLQFETQSDVNISANETFTVEVQDFENPSEAGDYNYTLETMYNGSVTGSDSGTYTVAAAGGGSGPGTLFGLPTFLGSFMGVPYWGIALVGVVFAGLGGFSYVRYFRSGTTADVRYH